jgi:hypothetical protein
LLIQKENAAFHLHSLAPSAHPARPYCAGQETGVRQVQMPARFAVSISILKV